MSNTRLLGIEVVGLRDVQGRFQRVTGELTAARREEMRNLGRKVVRAFQAEAPVRTGRLRKGIRYKTYERASISELRVTSEAPYTTIVLRGRGPVFAKNAKALRFQLTVGGPFIFRRSVGPARPNNFTGRALVKLGNEPMATARRIGSRIERAYSGR